jgi:hypothetical protein
MEFIYSNPQQLPFWKKLKRSDERQVVLFVAIYILLSLKEMLCETLATIIQPRKTHHSFQVFWPQGRKLEVQVTKALKTI